MKTMYIIRRKDNGNYFKGFFAGIAIEFTSKKKDAKIMSLGEARKIIKYMPGNLKIIALKY